MPSLVIGILCGFGAGLCTGFALFAWMTVAKRADESPRLREDG